MVSNITWYAHPLILRTPAESHGSELAETLTCFKAVLPGSCTDQAGSASDTARTAVRPSCAICTPTNAPTPAVPRTSATMRPTCTKPQSAAQRYYLLGCAASASVLSTATES